MFYLLRLQTRESPQRYSYLDYRQVGLLGLKKFYFILH